MRFTVNGEDHAQVEMSLDILASGDVEAADAWAWSYNRNALNRLKTNDVLLGPGGHRYLIQWRGPLHEVFSRGYMIQVFVRILK